eukprot:snap_masked-scaffold_2-processed-gene-19.16-mRNA-1 protein AED:1.00 eAED:1.00 QI:0/-1/0/0/-1/1/1/0/176
MQSKAKKQKYSSKKIYVGSKVNARYLGGAQYYPGTVVHIGSNERGQATVDVDYDDGDKEKNMPLSHIELISNPAVVSTKPLPSEDELTQAKEKLRLISNRLRTLETENAKLKQEMKEKDKTISELKNNSNFVNGTLKSVDGKLDENKVRFLSEKIELELEYMKKVLSLRTKYPNTY